MAITKSNGINRLIVRNDNSFLCLTLLSSLSFSLCINRIRNISAAPSLLSLSLSLCLILFLLLSQSLSLSLTVSFSLYLSPSLSLSLSPSSLPSDSVEGVFVASTSASHLILQFINKKVKKC